MNGEAVTVPPVGERIGDQPKYTPEEEWIWFVFWFFWSHVACRILVPRPGIEPRPLVLETWSPNHWTTREVPEEEIKLEYKIIRFTFLKRSL